VRLTQEEPKFEASLSDTETLSGGGGGGGRGRKGEGVER
jgi:hypothetical protein